MTRLPGAARRPVSLRPVSAPTDSSRPPYRQGREALLDAASQVIAARGFRGLTYRAVAEQAGVTHGLVGYHFGSRDRLIHETIQHVSEAAIADSGIVPESGRLEAFAANLSRLVSTAPDGQAVQFELALEARRHSELLPEIRALYVRYIELVDRTLADFGLDADDDSALARLVFAALDGLTLQQLIFGRPEQTDAAVELLRSMLADRRAAG